MSGGALQDGGREDGDGVVSFELFQLKHLGEEMWGSFGHGGEGGKGAKGA